MSDILKQFLGDPNGLAILIQPGELGKRTRVPVGCLAAEPAGDEVGATLGEGDRLDRLGGPLLFVRNRDWPIEFPFVSMATQDRYRAAASVTLSIRPRTAAVELVSLARAVMAGRDRLTAADLADWLGEPLAAALRAVAAGAKLEHLVESTDAASLAAELARRLAEPLFRAGLELVRVERLDFASADYQRRRQAESRAALAEDLARLSGRVEATRDAARTAQVRRLSELLGRLQELVGQLEPQADPRVRARQLARLLERFAPADREAFAAATPAFDAGQETRRPTVLLAAGEDVYRLAPGDDLCEPLAGAQEAAATLGPLRSLRLQDGRLLCGARDGVAILPVGPDGSVAGPAAIFRLPPSPRPRLGGVNAATTAGGFLLATHSEVGLVRWPMQEGPAAHVLFAASPDHAVRAVGPGLGGCLVFACDRTLFALPADAESADLSPLLSVASPVTAVCADLDALWVGEQSGGLWRADGQGAEQVGRLAGPICSIQPALLGCLERLLVATGRGGLVLQQPELGVSSRVAGDGLGVRAASCGAGWTVAVSEERDRLMIWPPGGIGLLPRVLRMQSQFGHSIQDMILVG
ncbi:MAG: hypothetical protein BIFFINMI_03200 [Phycisphaerae bacterium]|nr:hypothetical protein [Phycisphaerae bacterium]